MFSDFFVQIYKYLWIFWLFMIQNKTVKVDLLNAAGLGRQVLWQGKPPEIQYLIVRILAQHCLCTQLINPHLCKHCTLMIS